MQTQGPVARKESRKATQILRAGRSPPTQRDNPRKRGPGKGEYGHEVSILSRPRWRFGYFAAMGKVTRRPQAAKLPAKWRAGSSRPTPGKRLFLHRPLIRPLRGHLPLKGKAGRYDFMPFPLGEGPSEARRMRSVWATLAVTRCSRCESWRAYAMRPYGNPETSPLPPSY